MTVVIAEFYEALISAGADEGKARAAASAVADRAATAAVADRGRDIADMKADIEVLKWAVGVNSALAVVILALAMRLSFAVG